VGALQDILLDEKFEQLQKTFTSENCMQFDATEENKLVYTEIFKSYQETIESFIIHVNILIF
jgi:ADP-ribosylation factor 2-binding protein